MHDVMSAINVEMWKVVLPITCKYEKDVDKDSDSTMYMSIFHEENEKALKGTVPLKIRYVFIL